MIKQFLFLFVMLIGLGCIATNDPENISPEEIHRVVNYLSSDSLKGRRAGSEGIDLAATYIETYFKSNGVKPYYKTYRDDFRIKDSLQAYNVIGILEGTDPKLKNEIVILSAHYDHIGQGESIKRFKGKLTDVDSIANGANDNASGTAMVMALAKHFAKAKDNKRTLMFALFSGEEFGLKGSTHLSERLKNESVNLYIMINFEMMGVPFTDSRDYDVFLTGYNLSNMAEKINTYSSSNVLGKSNFAVKYNLFKRSDNHPFYMAFGVPCQTISSCDMTNYDFYHHVDDEADKLDYNHMAHVANALIPAIKRICNSETKEIKMYNE